MLRGFLRLCAETRCDRSIGCLHSFQLQTFLDCGCSPMPDGVLWTRTERRVNEKKTQTSSQAFNVG